MLQQEIRSMFYDSSVESSFNINFLFLDAVFCCVEFWKDITKKRGIPEPEVGLTMFWDASCRIYGTLFGDITLFCEAKCKYKKKTVCC